MASDRGSIEREKAARMQEAAAYAEALPPTSIRSQLEVWHAGRGDRSIAGAIIPLPRKSEDGSKAGPKALWSALREMSWMSWALFFSGWFAWTCDGYDYFTVSVTLPELAIQFDKPRAAITLAITLTLLFRSLGALIFGMLADRYGRKWTLVANMVIIAALELGSGFCNTYKEFLAVRSLFGVAMGGIWGQAAATCLENVPVDARGFLSGIVQQGYAVGYLLAAVINLTVGQYSGPKWRSLFFIGAGFSLLAAVIRALLPESKQFLIARQAAKDAGITSAETAKHFRQELWMMLKTNWIRAIWAICLMTGMNFFSHGSQDMYPTYLTVTKGLTSKLSSKATIISNCGAIAGGTFFGWLSQVVGRRCALIIALCWTACWIPLWILPKTFGGLAAGGFFLQSGVQGAWGVIPIYLSEIAPPAFRASFAGLSYQLGNMASSGSSEIVATASENLKLKGTNTPDYATIQGIFIGAVIAWTMLCTILGPEADQAHFEEAKVAVEDGAGGATQAQLVHRPSHVDYHHDGDKEREYRLDESKV